MGVRRMRCPRCNYKWYSKSSKMYVTCPNCYYKINVKKLTSAVQQREK